MASSKASIDNQMIYEGVARIVFSILDSKNGKKSHKLSDLSLGTDIFTDLGFDSLESLDLLSGLEEEFKVNPDQYEANDKRTIQQIVDYIVLLLEKKSQK